MKGVEYLGMIRDLTGLWLKKDKWENWPFCTQNVQQHPLIRGYTLNYLRIPNMIQGIPPN